MSAVPETSAPSDERPTVQAENGSASRTTGTYKKRRNGQTCTYRVFWSRAATRVLWSTTIREHEMADRPPVDASGQFEVQIGSWDGEIEQLVRHAVHVAIETHS